MKAPLAERSFLHEGRAAMRVLRHPKFRYHPRAVAF